MRTFLIAVTVVSMFAACKTNKKTDMDATGSSVVLVDSTETPKLPAGAKRVVVVERENADGSKTTTTTTDMNTKSGSAVKSNPVSSPSEVSPAPAVVNTVPVATPAKKKGWSTRAKGAVIGGVGGAATGVLISKDKVKGGILGGAIGAGGGYIIGNEIDRKKAKQ